MDPKEIDLPEIAILIIDDESLTIKSYKMLLESRGFNNIQSCLSAEEALTQLPQNDYSCVILDLHMPGMKGQELLEILTKDYPMIPVVIATAVNDVEEIVNCMKKGAFDYMIKPIERSRFVSIIKHAIELNELRRINKLLQKGFFSDELKNPENFSDIITENPSMLKIFKYIESIASTNQPVLITGETGTGKELIASSIHKSSNRKGGYVTVNVAGLDDNAFSDTLFGHIKGAFTGADNPRIGLAEKASEGTLFLDEIGDLSEQSQIKLLRLLQEKQFYPLGSDNPKTCNARILTATHKDVKTLMTEGKFRNDLYYRLSQHRIQLPNLRDRKEDIAVLADFFIKNTAKELNIKVPNIPTGLFELLKNYSFPGNNRELQSIIFDALTSPEYGSLSLDFFKNTLDIPDTLNAIGNDPNDGQDKISIHYSTTPTLKEVEEKLICQVLEECKGNLSKAAEILGISRVTLHRRLKK